jgi:hypothetical protein
VNIASPLTVDDTKFFLNTPAFLLAGQFVTAPIFDVTVPSTTSLGLYSGKFTILGGSSPSDLINIGSADFAVAVAVVPEPQTLILVTSGVIVFLLGRRRVF